MRTAISGFAAVAALALLSACATTPPGAEVARFHLGQPIPRSTVTLVPGDGSREFGLEYRSYADAVARELAAQSFITTVNDPKSAYVGTLSVEQSARSGPRRGGVSIGIGVGGFSGGRHGGGGIGGGVSVPVGQARPTDIVTTTLRLQLKRRSDGSVIWEGRASSEATGADADLPRVVPELAHALLDGFPGPAGQTVRVRMR